MSNHPNRAYRVVGDANHIVYSSHRSREAAERAARALARKWGWSHPGTEPIVQGDTETGWINLCGYTTADNRWGE